MDGVGGSDVLLQVTNHASHHSAVVFHTLLFLGILKSTDSNLEAFLSIASV